MIHEVCEVSVSQCQIENHKLHKNYSSSVSKPNRSLSKIYYPVYSCNTIYKKLLLNVWKLSNL